MNIKEPDLKRRFTNMTAIITGGTSGIGSAITKRFSSLNITCYFPDIRQPTEKSDNSTYIKADIASTDDVQAACDKFTQKYASPDILVGNAGIGIHQRLSERDPQKWAVVMETNVMGMLRFIRLFLPAMLEKKSGEVVFISSVSATHPYEWGGVYATLQIVTQFGVAVQLACSWNMPVGNLASIEATFYGTKSGASFKKKNGSFDDYQVEQFHGTQNQVLATAPDNWEGRASLNWVENYLPGSDSTRKLSNTSELHK